MEQSDSAEPTITRRALTRGAAWSVPAVALAMSVPAYAASTDVDLTITAVCDTNTTGTFLISAPLVAAGVQFSVVISQSGGGSFTVAQHPGFARSGNVFTATGAGVAFSGSISFASQHQTGQSSHTISATSGTESASVTTSRSGSAYSCRVN